MASIVFLKSGGPSVEEVEAARADAQRRADQEVVQLAKFRAKQRQSALRLSDLPGNEDVQTLKGAAETIEQLGERVGRDDLGQLVVTIPERTLTDTTGVYSIVERGNRQSAARAAQTLRHGERVVLAALERVGKGESLSTRLPDEVPYA